MPMLAGSAHLIFFNILAHNFAQVEGGMLGYGRTVFGVSHKLGLGNVLYGGEAYHDNGPWIHPDNYYKFNGLLTYIRGTDADGLSLTSRGYHGTWHSSDQIAANAVPLVGFFGTLNPTDGGNSQRYSLQAEWHRQGASSQTMLMGYGFYYDLDLFSDFTYYLTDPLRGDQFEQKDNRWVAGIDTRHRFFHHWLGRQTATTLGLQGRNDWIHNGLYQSEDRARVDKTDFSSGTVLPVNTEVDRFTDTQVGFFVYAMNMTVVDRRESPNDDGVGRGYPFSRQSIVNRSPDAMALGSPLSSLGRANLDALYSKGRSIQFARGGFTMRLQAMSKAMMGAAMMVVLGVSGSVAAQSGVNTVLKPADLAKQFPATVYYDGQNAPVQMRNTGGVKFSGGHFMMAGLVDTSGYSSGVASKYQGYLISEVPLTIGGKHLPVGAYGFGFLNDGKFVVTDLGGSDVLTASSSKDEAIERPRPLEVTTDPAGGFRLYAGRAYIVFSR